jgi:thioester reductase-like protein
MMQSLVATYALPENKPYVSNDALSTVLLTGTTGSLGAHMLALLGACAQVQHIFCLIRSHPDESREDMIRKQKEALDSRGIHHAPLLWSKTTVFSWSPGKDRLGLRSADYECIIHSVAHIFHAAWPMDFKMKLTSFEPHIKAVHDLLRLGKEIHAARPWVQPRVMLASSISVAANYQPNTPRVIVPEEPLDDPSTALPMGYAQAKWVCEQMMKSAFESSLRELVPSVVRIGQLSGSEMSGNWSVQEHFPVLVKASQSVGAMLPTFDINSHSSLSLGSQWTAPQPPFRSFCWPRWIQPPRLSSTKSRTPFASLGPTYAQLWNGN